MTVRKDGVGKGSAIVSFLLLPAIALIVKCNDGGPAFYAHPRVGKGFRPFRLLKFRTMAVDADKDGPLTKPADRRITQVGRLLRKYKLDELPQLWNVLTGDMQLVGVRPEVEHYVAMFREQYALLLREPPGITDPASLAYRCEEKLFVAERMDIASAFGVDGIALVDMAAQVSPQLRVFVLDTSFLFPETYRLIEQIEARYGFSVQRVLPALSPEEQAKSYGAALWSRDPDLCCHIRKVEPLQRQLANLRAWVTSIRRDQTPQRAHIRKIEWDARFRILKVNPLADWSRESIWQYVRERKLPYNPLHERSFPSIGCTHCTRAVKAGEDPRAGRWPGFAKTECGLHALTANELVKLSK